VILAESSSVAIWFRSLLLLVRFEFHDSGDDAVSVRLESRLGVDGIEYLLEGQSVQNHADDATSSCLVDGENSGVELLTKELLLGILIALSLDLGHSEALWLLYCNWLLSNRHCHLRAWDGHHGHGLSWMNLLSCSATESWECICLHNRLRRLFLGLFLLKSWFLVVILPLLVGILMRLVAAVVIVAGSILSVLLSRHLVLVLRRVGGPLVLVLVLVILRSARLIVALSLARAVLPLLLVLRILLRILIPVSLAAVSATTVPATAVSPLVLLLTTTVLLTLIILVSLMPTILVTPAISITIGLVTCDCLSDLSQCLGEVAFLGLLLCSQLAVLIEVDAEVLSEGVLEVELLHGVGGIVGRCVRDDCLAEGNCIAEAVSAHV